MNREMIPPKLQHFIPLVERWGIDDDGFRDDAVLEASDSELEELVSSITHEDALELEKWFVDPQMLAKPTHEYLKYSVFFMAAEYAKVVLNKRKRP